MKNPTKIISGGQTGVDQAALRIAQHFGFQCGGWCPPRRVCESGTIPDHFPLEETPRERSSQASNIPRSQRTEWNVRDSDATLIISPQSDGRQDPGTDWTVLCTARYGRPLFISDPGDPEAAEKIRNWLNALSIRTLNVAGPSELTVPGIGEQSYALLASVFTDLVTPSLIPIERETP